MVSNIVCLGSPLIDIIVNVERDFLRKHDLKPESCAPINEKLTALYPAIESRRRKTLIGGSIINTARMLRQLVRPGDLEITVWGSVGLDEEAELFKKTFRVEQIGYNLEEIPDQATGKVIVLIAERNSRCMVTDLRAAQVYPVAYCNRKLVEQVDFLYFSALFLRVNGNFLQDLVRQMQAGGKKIFINLGAPFIVKQYKNDVNYLCSVSAIIFGNNQEFEALFEANHIQDGDTRKKLTRLDEILINDAGRYFVVTNGSNPVIVYNEQEINEYAIEPIEEGKILDTTGAGDAFVGGFLSQHLFSRSLKISVECGIIAAKEVIQNQGFTYDTNLKY